MDENIKKGEDFLKEVTEEEKEVKICFKISPRERECVHVSCRNIWFFVFMFIKIQLRKNKKVLLRERKRHTDHRVANTPSVVLTGWGGRYPIPGPGPNGGGYKGVPPVCDLARGIPPI